MTGASHRALVVRSGDEGALSASLSEVDEGMLGDGDVTIDVAFSGVNYKDALALTGRPGVVRATPLVAGIDAAGIVTASGEARFSAGDAVVATGAGLGETRHGGLAERLRMPADALVRIPEAFSLRQAAAIGTAGFTAALCVLALADGGVRPGDEVLVTGAAGGVGSIAVALASAAGWHVAAASRRAGPEGDYLRGLGAADVVEPASLAHDGRGLGSARWSGVVDTVGSGTLASALARCRRSATVAACGLAGGADLPGSMLPFILRAVTLRGIDSVASPPEERRRAWELLAERLDVRRLDALTTEVALGEAVAMAERVLAGDVRGRTVVDVRR